MKLAQKIPLILAPLILYALHAGPAPTIITPPNYKIDLSKLPALIAPPAQASKATQDQEKKLLQEVLTAFNALYSAINTFNQDSAGITPPKTTAPTNYNLALLPNLAQVPANLTPGQLRKINTDIHNVHSTFYALQAAIGAYNKNSLKTE